MLSCHCRLLLQTALVSSPHALAYARHAQNLNRRCCFARMAASSQGVARFRPLRPPPQESPVVQGVVFDMDGTLTVPVIDFKLMRQRVGVPTGDILDAIHSWPPDKQKTALAAMEEIETAALKNMQLMPGLMDLCQFLDEQGIPRGLITRNVKRSIDYFHLHHFNLPVFDPAISRECGHEYKPSPAALRHICQSWGISTCNCVMVGDSAPDDVASGIRAGAITILLDSNQIYSDETKLTGECRPHYKVATLSEVHELMQTMFKFLPPSQVSQELQ